MPLFEIEPMRRYALAIVLLLCFPRMKALYTTFTMLVTFGAGLALTSFYLADPVKISLKHDATLAPGQTAQVEVTVDKGTIEGFGLLELPLPSETKAEAIELNGASFNIENGKIRIVWMRMPNDAALHVSFNITNTSATQMNLKLSGNFSHIENNYRKDVAFESNGNNSSEPIDTKTPEISSENTAQSNQASSGSQEAIQENNIEQTQTNQPETKQLATNDLTFRVQILASHRVVDKSFLNRIYGFQNTFNIEHHNGWEKYVTGEFKNLEDARKLRSEIASAHPLLPGPFVTAYKGNERISVTEALRLQMTASL